MHTYTHVYVCMYARPCDMYVTCHHMQVNHNASATQGREAYLTHTPAFKHSYPTQTTYWVSAAQGA